MEIKNRIKLGNNDYYISYNCIYKTNNGYTKLYLKDHNDDYYDGGDLAKLIKKIEENYNNKNNESIKFLSDCIYIYENIPFISGIGDINNNSISYISKEELDNYIKEQEIKLKDNSDFKLHDERTWY